MIGNDVVDLQQALKDSNWKRPRFLNKIFTTEEQEIIQKSTTKSQTIWLLWSMKEASYKAYIQKYKTPFFNPKKIVCQLTSSFEGKVIINHTIYKTKTIISPDYIYSIATASNFKHTISDCFSIQDTSYESQTNSVKTALLKSFSIAKEFPLEQLSIKKTAANIPNLYYNSIVQENALSITHHGLYCGYIFLL